MADTENNNIAIVNKSYNGWRIDKFLSVSFPEVSRSQIQRLLKDDCITKDGEIINDSSYKVKENEEFQLFIPEPEDANPEPEDIPLDIVYEDEDLLVVNKPAGMTVHPAPGAYHGTLVNALLFHCRGNLSGIGGVKRPGIVHRIDKDTSGLLVVAKNDMTHKSLCAQFAEHSIERTYFAVVYGVPAPLAGRIEGNIGRSPYDRKKMAIVRNGGKSAATNYKTLQIFHNAAALVQCNLETGRTHQIRVHMSSIGCHLVGDKVYEKSGKTTVPLPATLKHKVNSFPRQALHAATLGFIHPRSKKFIRFECEFPQDIRELIEELTG